MFCQRHLRYLGTLAIGVLLTCFATAVRGDQTEDAQRLKTAIRYVRGGWYIQAYDLLAPLVRGKRSWWNAHYYFAVCGRMLAKPLDEIVGQLKISIALAPDNPFVYVVLGKAYLDHQRPHEAVKAFRAALRRNPGDHATRWLLVRAYRRSAQNAQALAELLRLGGTKEYRNSWAIREALAQVYEALGRLVDAERRRIELLQENGRQYEHRVALYRFYLRHRMHDKARQILPTLVPSPTSRPVIPGR